MDKNFGTRIGAMLLFYYFDRRSISPEGLLAYLKESQ
jgi:hypothetical protein